MTPLRFVGRLLWIVWLAVTFESSQRRAVKKDALRRRRAIRIHHGGKCQCELCEDIRRRAAS